MPRMDRTIRIGQRMAKSLMTDVVRIERDDPNLKPTWDDDGNIVEPTPLVVYEGPGKFQHSDPYPSSPDAGEARWTAGVRQLHLPIGTTVVQSGDIATCLKSRNPRVVGLTVRLRIDGDKTWTTAVRFNAQEVLTSGNG